MRIAVLSVFPPFRGGIAQFNASMCNAFEAEGHDLLRVNFSRQYPHLLFPGKSQFESDTCVLENPLLDSINPISWGKTARFVLDFSPDIVVIPFWQVFLLPSLTSTIRHIKSRSPNVEIIGLMHNATPHDSQFLAALLVGRFLSNVDSAWTLSASVAAHPFLRSKSTRVKELFHPTYNHFPPLCDKSNSRSKLGLPQSDEAHVLLFFGLIRPYKGLDVLIHSLQLLKGSSKPIHLVIAGECYEDWSKYEMLIQASGVSPCVHIYNSFIADEDVPVFFGAADLVCLPYRTASQSGVTAIAIQYGKPVVASAVGGLTEYFEGNSLGNTCPPNDAKLLAAAIASQLDAPSPSQDDIKILQRRFSWKTFVQRALSGEDSLVGEASKF